MCAALESNDYLELHVGNPAGSSEEQLVNTL